MDLSDSVSVFALIFIVLCIAALVVVPFFLMWLIMKLPWPEETRRETTKDQEKEASNGLDV